MIIFNGIDLEEYLVITNIKGRGLAGYDITTVKALHLNGERFAGKRKPMREISVEFTLPAEDAEEVRLLLDVLNSVFAVDEPVPIKFKDEPTMTYYGIPEGASDKRDFVRFHQGTITFLCPDPYKYGPERNEGFTTGSAIITNRGSAPSDPIFEMTVTKPTTFAIVANGNDEFNLLGKQVSVEEKIVDERVPLFTERGDTLSAWTTSPVTTSEGQFTSSGDAIVIDSWGTGTGWNGAALMRSISPTEDFEVEMYIYVRSETPERTFRASFNLYDEHMEEIGMIRLWDNSPTTLRKVAEARVGSFVGHAINYLMYSRNYDMRGQKVWGGILRVRRVGSKIEFYVARVTQGGKHVDSMRRTYNDVEGKYSGLLRHIQFDVKRHGSTATPNEIRVEHIKATKLSKAKVDETPYIAYAGDVITFDHVRDEVQINGEERSDLKDFGGTFFKLQQGENAITSLPVDSTAAQVTFRDKYH